MSTATVQIKPIRVKNPEPRMLKYYKQRAEEVREFIEQNGGAVSLAELLERFSGETLCIFFQIVKVKVRMR